MQSRARKGEKIEKKKRIVCEPVSARWRKKGNLSNLLIEKPGKKKRSERGMGPKGSHSWPDDSTIGEKKGEISHSVTHDAVRSMRKKQWKDKKAGYDLQYSRWQKRGKK